MTAPPETSASLWQRATFSWASPLFLSQHAPTPTEFWALPERDLVHAVCERAPVGPALMPVLRGLVRGEMVRAGVLLVLVTLCSLTTPLFMQALLNGVQVGDYTTAYGYAGGIAGALLVKAFLEGVYYWETSRAGWTLKAFLARRIFEKTLVLSLASKHAETTGQISNLQQLDAEKIAACTDYLHYLWVGPLQVVAYMAILYTLIGPASLVGLGVLLLSIPAMGAAVARLVRMDRKAMQFSDARVKVVHECISNPLSALKFTAWEGPFLTKIAGVRSVEVQSLRSGVQMRSVMSALMSSAPALTAAASLAVYALVLNGTVDAATLFASLTAFNNLRGPLMLLPMAFTQSSVAYVSVKRVSAFLGLGEVSPPLAQPATAAAPGEEDEDTVISLQDVDAFWAPTDERPILFGLSFRVKRRECVAIVGAHFGVGKSALINTLLGEMTTCGHVKVCTSAVSLASQMPWLVNGSVRENILFGAPFEEARYSAVLECCQLVKDLQQLPSGDLTELGERGFNLSGGQRARCGVARALYHGARPGGLVILDDPFSALDPEVSDALFQEAVLEFAKDATRLVVTNHLDFLSRFDKVLFLDSPSSSSSSPSPRGRTTIVEQGTYEELTHPGRSGAFAQLMASVSLLTTEEKEVGVVRSAVYVSWIRAGGGAWACFGVMLVFLVMMAAFIVNSVWITWWVNDKTAGYVEHSEAWWIAGYAVTAAVVFVTAYARTIGIYEMGIRATTSLHDEALSRVFWAPLSFFEVTPVGRLLQRFSRDVRALDTDIPDTMAQFLFLCLFMSSSLVMVIALTPLAAAVLVPGLIPLLYLLSVYRPRVREAKREGALANSPVYVLFEESLSGIVLIRAYRQQTRFLMRQASLLDEATRLYYYALRTCERWISLRFDVMGSLVTLVACCLAVQAVQSGSLTPAGAGLSISFSIYISAMSTQFIRSFAVVETAMNSVERMLWVAEHTPQELREGTTKVDASWPARGRVQVKGLTMRYRPSQPLVLKDVSFEVQPGERLGIVGRSGCGKSSLFVAMLRIAEPEPGSEVMLDEVNVRNVDLAVLRARVGVAPQAPVMFSGTLRENVDPFRVASTDEEVWHALEVVGLKGLFKGKPTGLDTEVAEFGANLSQGERQLVSLARLLLRRPSLVLLDEATASLDADTDATIQHALRTTTFSRSTFLIIAHRLTTIADANRLLVLGAGGVVLECGPTRELLDSPTSELNRVLSEMSEKEAARVRAAGAVIDARGVVNSKS